jgi:hypothetical protein
MDSASIQVTSGGRLFSFSFVSVYSSTTNIPFIFTGKRNGSVVFQTSGTAPHSSAAFVKVSSGNTSLIDTLEITLTNMTFATCCLGNDMGLDTIVVSN